MTTTRTGRTRWGRWSASDDQRCEPDRRRTRRQVDRRQGVRDELVLGRGSARLRAVDPGADQPRGPEPPARPAAAHRQQLVGRRRRRSVVPGDSECLDRLGHLPRLLERQHRAGLRHRRLTRRLHEQLQRRGLRHQQRDRQLLEPRACGCRRRRGAQAEHLGAGRERPIVDELQRLELRGVQRHIHGLAARGRHRRAHLVGEAGPTGGHPCDENSAGHHRYRYLGSDLRRHRRRQQRLGRGQARRLRSRRRHASAATTTSATAAASSCGRFVRPVQQRE